MSALDFASLLDVDEYVVVMLSVYKSATLSLSAPMTPVSYKFYWFTNVILHYFLLGVPQSLILEPLLFFLLGCESLVRLPFCFFLLNCEKLNSIGQITAKYVLTKPTHTTTHLILKNTNLNLFAPHVQVLPLSFGEMIPCFLFGRSVEHRHDLFNCDEEKCV